MSQSNYSSETPGSSYQGYFNSPKNKNTKNIVIGVLAACLLGTWAYLLYSKNKSGKTITEQQASLSKVTDEKSELQVHFNEALARLDSLTGENNNLQGEKSALQKEIDVKKSEIRKILNDKNASQAQLTRAKTLISELNTKISGLEEEINRLSGENRELNTANTNLRQEKAELETNLTVTKSEKNELTKTVDVASTFSASNIQVIPVNEKKSGKEKSTATSKKVDKLLVSFDIENRIAKSGPADMYLIVTSPDGTIISEGKSLLTTRTDGDKNFTAKIPIEFVQGERKSIQFPIRQQDFKTGNYKIEIYHNGFKIGETVRSLKKGGLFG